MTGRNLKIASLVGLVILLTASVGAAQAVHRVKAFVPFEFRVDDTLYPAGEYVVTYPLKPVGDIALLTDSAGKGLQLIGARRCDRSAKTDEAYLLFRGYGQEHFLVQIGGVGLGPNLELGVSRSEREVIRSLAHLKDGKKAKGVLVAAR
jgi:hypothetical protein